MLQNKRSRGGHGLRRIPLVLLMIGTIPFLGAYESPDDGEGSRGGRCYNCDPPEIYSLDQITRTARLRTGDQSGGGYSQAAVALSYFAGLVKSYTLGDPASGYATQFSQSDATTAAAAARADWFYDVLLAEPYDPAQDVGVALRKVDEPASPARGDQQDCPQDVPNAERSFIFIDTETKIEMMERFELCMLQYGLDWQECHYGPDHPYDPLIRIVQINVPQPTGCEPTASYLVCAEVSDVTMRTR